MSEKDLIDVIDKIYGAATEIADWNDLVGDVASLFGRATAELQFVDYVSNDYDSLGAAGFNPTEWLKKPAFSDWPQHDPWKAAGALAQGSVIVGSKSLSALAYRDSTFHNDYARAAGWNWRDVLACTLQLPGYPLGLLCVYSDWRQSDFDDRDAALMARLQPHLEKALYVRAQLSAAHDMFGVQSSWLEHMPYGLAVLDERSRVVFHNRQFEERVNDDSALTINSSKVHLADHPADDALQHAIRNAQATTPSCSAGHTKILFYDDVATDTRYSVLVVSVRRHDLEVVRLTGTATPRVLILVSSNHPKVDRQASLCAQLYDLTPTEVKVARSLAEGGTISSTARRYGTSIHTVRTQLRSIFAKTDTHTQSDLVRLLLTMPFSIL